MNGIAQRAYLNLCELFIDTLSLKKYGFVKFVWKKGIKHIKSLAYEPKNDLYQIKELLTLNLKVYSKGSTALQKNTVLHLLDAEDREIDRIFLRVDLWKDQYRNIEVPIAGGKLVLRCRRKQVMQLQSFKRVRTELDQSSEESQFGQMSRYTHHSHHTQHYSQIQILQEEMDKIRKQLEDAYYLNNKRKNDRDVLISQVKDIQHDHSQIIKRVMGEIGTLRAHFEQKIEIRQSIYKEQIRLLAQQSNQQLQINIELIQKITQQNIQYEKELRNTQQKMKNDLADAEQNSRKHLQQQDKIHRNTIQNHQIQFNKATIQVQKLQKDLQQMTKQILKLRQHLGEEQQKNEVLKSRGEENLKLYTNNLAFKQEAILQLDGKIKDLQIKIQQRQRDLQAKTYTIQQCQKQLKESQQLAEQLREQLSEQTGNLKMINSDKFRIECEVQKIRAEIQEKTNELEFMENLLEDQKAQMTHREEDFLNQMRKLEQIQIKKHRTASEQIFKAHQNIKDLEKSNYSCAMLLQQLEDKIRAEDLQIQVLGTEINQLNIQKDSLLKVQQDFVKQNSEKLKQIGALQDSNMKTVALNEKLKSDLQKSGTKIQEISQVVQDCNRKLQQCKEMYEQELQLLRKQIKVVNEEYERSKSLNAKITQQISERSKEHEQQLIEKKQIYEKALESKNKVIKQQKQIIQQLRQEISNQTKYISQSKKDLKKAQDRIQELLHTEQQITQFQRIVDTKQTGAQYSDKLTQRYTNNNDKAIASEEEHFGDQSIEKGEKMLSSEVFGEYKNGRMKEIPRLRRQTMSLSIRRFTDAKQKLMKSVCPGQIMGKMKKQIQFIRTSIRQQSESVSRGRPVDLNKMSQIEKSINNLQRQFTRKEQQFKDSQTLFNQRQQELVEAVEHLEDQLKLNNEEISQLKDQISKLLERVDCPIGNIGIQSYTRQSNSSYLRKLAHGVSVSGFVQAQHKKDMSIQVQFNTADSLLSHSNKMSTAVEQQLKRLQEDCIQRGSIIDIQAENILKLHEQVRKSEMQFNQLKAQLEIKVSFATNRAQQAERKEKYSIQQKKTLQQTYGKEKIVLKNQIQTEIEKFQKYKAQKHNVIAQYQSQLKKLRTKLSQIEDRKKSAGPDLLTQYQHDMEQSNKKLMALSRLLNQEKLERQNLQDELKMIRKKMQEILKTSQESDQKISSSQKRLEESKRIEAKLKRQIQDKEEKLSKLGYENKNSKEQIQRLTVSNSQLNMEKKITQEQINQLNDQIAKKQQQVSKVSKELDKCRAKVQRNEEERTQRKQQLKKEIDRLGIILAKSEKKNNQYEEENRIVRGRLQTSEKEKKKILEEKTQSYGDKLNLYVEEIGKIKRMLEQNQSQVSTLKIQNSQFFEQNQMLKGSFQKLEIKYEQSMQNQQIILNDNACTKEELNRYKEQCQNYDHLVQKLEFTIEKISKELEEQRAITGKMNQKLRLFQETSERYVQQLKNMRIKINENQVDAQAISKLQQKYKNEDKKASQLERILHSTTCEFEAYRIKYTVTQPEYQKSIGELKKDFKTRLETELESLQKSLIEKHSNRKKQLQDEVLEMFNQNTNTRLQIQKLNEQNERLKLNVHQLKQAENKIQELTRNNESLLKTLGYLKQSQSGSEERIKRAQGDYKIAQEKNEKILQELDIIKDKYDELLRKNKALNQAVKDIEIIQQNTTGRFKTMNVEKGITIENLRSDIQILNKKLRTSQSQNNRMKQSEVNITERYSSKIKKLQKKMNEMSEATKDHKTEVQKGFNKQMNSMQITLMQYNQELVQKGNRISQLNLALQESRLQTEGLGKELASVRFKANTEIQMRNQQINKFKIKLRETEQAFNQNIKQLEQQLSAMSKELTHAKLNRANLSISKIGVASEVQEKFAKRNEEKLKIKDKKIEELKITIHNLQDSIMKLKRKQTSQSMLTDYQKIKLQNYELHRQIKVIGEGKQQETTRFHQQIRQLKKDNIDLKERQQQLSLQHQQKDLQINSLTCELKTIKQLYQQMHKQLSKRKELLSEKTMQNDAEIRLQQAMKKVEEYQSTIQSITKSLESVQTELRKKNLDVRKLQEEIRKMEGAESQNKNLKFKRNADMTQLRKEIKDKNNIIENLKSEINKVNVQINQYVSQISAHRNQKNIIQQHAESLQRIVDQQIHKLNENALTTRFYHELKLRCKQDYNMTLEQYIAGRPWEETIRQKEIRITQLNQQMEQLKFVQERTYLDYEELKKEHYQIQIRGEDNSFLGDQLDNLRKVCDRLKEEKQNAVFKEEAIRVQLENIVQSQSKEVKNRIKEILRKSYL